MRAKCRITLSAHIRVRAKAGVSDLKFKNWEKFVEKAEERPLKVEIRNWRMFVGVELQNVKAGAENLEKRKFENTPKGLADCQAAVTALEERVRAYDIGLQRWVQASDYQLRE